MTLPDRKLHIRTSDVLRKLKYIHGEDSSVGLHFEEPETPSITVGIATGARVIYDVVGYCTGGRLAALLYALFAPGSGYFVSGDVEHISHGILEFTYQEYADHDPQTLASYSDNYEGWQQGDRVKLNALVRELRMQVRREQK